MHILLLSAGKVFKSAFGGEDLFSRLLGRWLANNHNEVTLMGIEFAGTRTRYLTRDRPQNHVTPNTAKTKNNANKIGLGYLLYSLRTVIWLFQVVKILSINAKHSIDIIHAQDSGYTGLAAITAAKILNIPVMITLHGIRYNQIEANPYVNSILKKIALKIERRLDVFTLSNANVIAIVSSTMEDYVRQVAPRSNIVTIPVAINKKNYAFSDSKRDLFRKEFEIDNTSSVLGYVGRLSYEKNLFTLLDAFAEATVFNPSIKLIIVGEGPLEFDLRKRANVLGIKDRAIFCGFRNDIDNVLSAIDIFVLPSFIEGTSNALLEAMTCGRAIICSDISGNREIVTNDKDALMVKPKDRDGLKEAIKLLSSDGELRRRLGDNARINAAQYDEDIIFPKFVHYYQDICKSDR